jgi:hypothetical protein
MKSLLGLMLIWILVGCDQTSATSCTDAQLHGRWLHIQDYRIRLDKIMFVRIPYQRQYGGYRIVIGLKHRSFWIDDDDRQACESLLEDIINVKPRVEGL